MKRDEVVDKPNVVVCTLSIHSYQVTVLFGSGAHHYFVTSIVVNKLRLVSSFSSPAISVTTRTGDFE